MHSGSEKQFAELCDKFSIKWVKNSTIFFTYANKNNKESKYYPDFYLEEFDIWVEVKGKYYFDEINDPLKWKAVKNIEIIWADDIKLPTVCTSHDLVLED